jgi:hypothetical protein
MKSWLAESRGAKKAEAIRPNVSTLNLFYFITVMNTTLFIGHGLIYIYIYIYIEEGKNI